MGSMENALNKGVPNDIEIRIPYPDIIEISNNQNRTTDILNDAIDAYHKRISDLTNKSYRFFYTNAQLLISTDMNDLGKYITLAPDYIEFLLTITLNVDNINERLEQEKVIEDDGLFYSEEKVAERLAILRKMKNPRVFQRNFPCLYAVYKDIEALRNDLNTLREKSLYQYMQAVKENGLMNQDLEIIESSGSLQQFIDYVSSAMQTAIDNKDEIVRLALENRINSHVFGFATSSRLELYLADTYASIAMASSSDLTTKQKCSYYLSAYMFENEGSLDDGRTVKRVTSNSTDGQQIAVITKRSVYEKFKRLLIDNPELFNVNFDNHIFNEMTVDEVDKLMASYMESIKLKWDIIPDGDEITVGPVITRNPRGLNTKTTTRTKKDATELFYQKKAFFDSSEPLLRVMGKDTFNGYIGYIYPNGTVILDKFYEDSVTRRLAEDVAIYCMGIDDFYRLSQLSKSEIIRDRLCKRFYHRGDWQTRVQSEITGDAAVDMHQKTKILRQLGEYSSKSTE